MKYQKNPNTKCTCSNPKHHAKWILNEAGIIRSVEAVLKSGDSYKLTKDAYELLHNMSGFIAHYDINGFMATYSNVELLRSDILNSSDVSDYSRYTRDSYFAQGEQSEYYAQKARVYKKLGELAVQYAGVTQDKEARTIDDKIALLAEIAKRAAGDKVFAKKILQEIGML